MSTFPFPKGLTYTEQERYFRELYHTMTPMGLTDEEKDFFLQEVYHALIPTGLTHEEQKVYRIMIHVRIARVGTGILAIRITVFLDIAKDYDDLTAVVLLRELARLGLICPDEDLKFIATLKLARKRGIYCRGALDSIDLEKSLVGVGTDGTIYDLEVYNYEFDAPFMPDEKTFIPKGNFFENGSELLHQTLTKALREGRKETLLLISSLTDINNYAKAHPEIFRDAVGRVYMQGGYSISADGVLMPHPVANNKFDPPASAEFHKQLSDDHKDTHCFTRVAAYAAEMSADVFRDLEATKHPIGTHLRTRHLKGDVAFYKVSCSSKPFNDMTQERFLHKKTSFYVKHPPGPLRSENGTPLPLDGTPLPEGDGIIPYLTVLVVYDALPALASGGEDLIAELGVLNTKSMAKQESIHKLIGTPESSNINPQRMAFVISTLLKGSLYHSMALKH